MIRSKILFFHGIQYKKIIVNMIFFITLTSCSLPIDQQTSIVVVSLNPQPPSSYKCNSTTIINGREIPCKRQKQYDLSGFCSRGGVGETRDHWKVSNKERYTIDSKLVKFSFKNHLLLNLDVSKYARQYLGFHTLKGKKRVYINASLLDSDMLHPLGLKELRNLLIEGCDGGSYFWGIVYDFESSKFINFQINGSIE